jgi:hypothetical protein
LGSFEQAGVHFWPSFGECFAHGDKLKQAQRLDTIATQFTFSPRPNTRRITLRKASSATEGVLKRSFSDKSSHVYDLSDAAEKAKINSDIDIGNAGLILQDYISTLKTHGELRVAISYGCVIWRVWTKRDKDGRIEFVDVSHPKKILNVPTTYTFFLIWVWVIWQPLRRELRENAFDNDHVQTSFEIASNLKDIDDFALRTLKELIKLETEELSYEPSLSAFARLDIGFMPDHHGKAKFFVNEVERLPAVTLWRGAHHIGQVAANLDHGLYKATKARAKSLTTSEKRDMASAVTGGSNQWVYSVPSAVSGGSNKWSAGGTAPQHTRLEYTNELTSHFPQLG